MPRWSRRAQRSSGFPPTPWRSSRSSESEFNLPFVLLSDEKGTVVEQYPGKIAILGVANRATYVIGQDGVIQQIVTGGDAIDPSTAVAACPIGKKK